MNCKAYQYNIVSVWIITTALQYTKDAVGASISLSIECPPDQIKIFVMRIGVCNGV